MVLHALAEAYRNIIPPTSFPVVLLFLEMPPQEVDVNVHPAKTEVRFRQSGFVHDFIRDSVRTALMTARPAASFAVALGDCMAGHLAGQLVAAAGRESDAGRAGRRGLRAARSYESEGAPSADDVDSFMLRAPVEPPSAGRLAFSDQALRWDTRRRARRGRRAEVKTRLADVGTAERMLRRGRSGSVAEQR